ncbi:MAG: amidohydrolase family protein, partial [Acidimicrobiales bacterium]
IYTRHHGWTGQEFGSMLPSEVFQERVVLCFIDDPSGMELRHRVGVEKICWESDYPHSDSTWPISPETLWPSLAGVPDDEVAAMTHENAMRHFRFDPFTERPREMCTVGALRAGAGDVDVRQQASSLSGATRGPRLTKAADLTRAPGANR